LNQTDQHPVNIEQIEQGLQILKRRQRNLTGSVIAITAIGVASFVTIFFQQELVFHFFGLSTHVEHLHLPFTVDAKLREYLDAPDYLMNAFSWLGWLIYKLQAQT